MLFATDPPAALHGCATALALALSVRELGYRRPMDVCLALDSGPKAAHLARDELRSRLGDRLSADFLLSVLLIASELVTNSVRHGPGGPIELAITVNDDGSVRGEVEDRGDGEVKIRDLTRDGAGGGFGLRIVEALADRWGVYEDRTKVWFEMSSPKSS